jgi:DNA repair protein RadC
VPGHVRKGRLQGAAAPGKADDLTQFEGVGDAKATLILAAIEFARRRIKPEGAKIETPADLQPQVRHYADRETGTFPLRHNQWSK